MQPVKAHHIDGVGIVTLQRPPVNALGVELRRALYAAIDAFDRDDSVCAIVLHGQGRGFSAGGDVHEFGTPAAVTWPGLSSDLHPRIEGCRKPVVAAVHGLCLGGGFETALACHWRVGSSRALVGLPETRVGALPVSGTQRLPRLIGLERAAAMVARALVVPAAELHPAFDRLIDADDPAAVLAAAVAVAQAALLDEQPLRRVRDLPPPKGREAVLAELAQDVGPVVRHALEALLAAADSHDFDSGLARARGLYEMLVRNDDALVLRRAFTNARPRAS